jgi:hypothetical protein
MPLERTCSPNPSVIVELQNRLGNVENQCSELEQELENQGNRITEFENEVWRARVEAVGIERKSISSVDSVQLKMSKRIDSEGMEADRLKVLIEDKVMRSCGKDCVRCELHSDCPMDGIISYLTKKCGGNVSELNIVDITSEMSNVQLKCVADLESLAFLSSGDSPNQWVCYQFKRHSVNCNGYSIHTPPIDGIDGIHHPRSWIIEGSSNGNNWMILDEEQHNNELRESDVWRSFRIGTQASVSQIRLRQTGLNHGGDHILALSGFEIFGTLFEC